MMQLGMPPTDRSMQPIRPPFPFLTAVRDAIELASANLSVLVRVTLGWAIVICIVNVGWTLGLRTLLQSDPDLMTRFSLFSASSQALLFAGPPIIALLFGMAAVAVAWHRFAILEERPQSVLPFNARRVVHYVARSLLLFAMVGALTMLGVGFASYVGSAVLPPIAMAAIPMVALLVSIYAMLRAGLALPGAAVGDRLWTLERSWQETRGHGLRLLGGMAIISLPFYFLNTALSAAQGPTVELPIALVVACFSFAVTCVGAALGAGYFSRAFFFFSNSSAKDRPPASHFS